MGVYVTFPTAPSPVTTHYSENHVSLTLDVCMVLERCSNLE